MLPPSDLRVVSKHYDMTAALEPQIAFLLSSNSQYTHTKGMDRFANKNKHTKTFVEVKAIWSPFVTLNNFIMAVRKKKGRLLDWSQGVTNLVVKSDQVYRLSFYGAVSRSLRSEATRSLSTVTATFTGGIPHQSVGSCHLQYSTMMHQAFVSRLTELQRWPMKHYKRWRIFKIEYKQN